MWNRVQANDQKNAYKINSILDGEIQITKAEKRILY